MRHLAAEVIRSCGEVFFLLGLTAGDIRLDP